MTEGRAWPHGRLPGIRHVLGIVPAESCRCRKSSSIGTGRT